MEGVCKCPVKTATVINDFDHPKRIPLPNGWSHLQFHVAIFAEQDKPIDERRFITFESAAKAMQEIGISILLAAPAAAGVALALPSKTNGKDYKVDIQNIVNAKHRLNTRIFNADGMFDAAQFEAIMLGYSEEYRGERVITESGIKRMHEDFKIRDENITTCLERFIDNLASNGEFSGLLAVLADETLKVDGREERFIREDLFRSFYADGPFDFEVAKYYQKINKAQTVNEIYKSAVNQEYDSNVASAV